MFYPNVVAQFPESDIVDTGVGRCVVCGRMLDGDSLSDVDGVGEVCDGCGLAIRDAFDGA